MQPHVLIAIDEFSPAQIERMTSVLAGRATWERIPKNTPGPEYRARLAQAQVSLGWPDPHWLLDGPLELHLLGSVGYEAYLGIGLAEKPGFRLCNARGVMSVAVAEHCLALMLALARRLPRHLRDQPAHRWERQPAYGEISGTTACILGLGSIGSEIARRCAALGMRVVGVDPDPQAGEGWPARVYPPEQLPAALAQADHVVLVFPARPENRQMFDARLLAAIKPGAYFYNLARGSLVDEPALIAALQCGALSGAGLDALAEEPLPPGSPLWDLENVIITPHVGGRSVHEFERMSVLFAHNLERYLNGEALINRVALY